MIPFSQVNIVAVLVASAAIFFIGFLWHGPLFGKQWMKLINLSQADMQKGAGAAMIKGVINALVSVYVLALLLEIAAPGSMQQGMVYAFLLWLGLVAKSHAELVIWEGRSMQLFYINTGYSLISLLTATGVLLWWPQ